MLDENFLFFVDHQQESDLVLNLDSPAPIDRHGESLGTFHLTNIVQTTIFILKMFLFYVGRYFCYCNKIRIGKIAKGDSYVQKANRFWATFFHKVIDVLWNLSERWGLSRDFHEITADVLQQVVSRFRDCAQEIELVCLLCRFGISLSPAL